MNRYKTKPYCGTRAGYDYHVRQAKENPCDPCRTAEKAYWRGQRLSRNEEINSKRRARNAVRRAENQLSQTNWYAQLPVIVVMYGSKCHLGENCFLDDLEIDFEAPRLVGQPGWERSFHPDHVVPLSKGGSDTIDNIRPAHGYCNQRKWATLDA